MDVLIVGAGTMGRWFARAISEAGTTVALADVDPDAAEGAAAAVGGRPVPLDADERFDAVCFAVPLSVVERAIAEHAPRARTALVDVSGAMAGPVAAMAEHAPDRERLSLHPLFAAKNAPGNVAFVADAAGPTTDEILERLAARGNTLVETTPEEHDRAMETIQSRAHAAALAFALAAEETPEGFETPVSRALWDVVERVTDGDPRVYAEIQEAFPGAEDVASAAERIAAADREEFERLYREARDR